MFISGWTDTGLAAYPFSVIGAPSNKTELASFLNSRTSLAGTVLGRGEVICHRFHLSAAPRIAPRVHSYPAEIIDDVGGDDKPFRRLAWNSISKASSR